MRLDPGRLPVRPAQEHAGRDTDPGSAAKPNLVLPLRMRPRIPSRRALCQPPPFAAQPPPASHHTLGAGDDESGRPGRSSRWSSAHGGRSSPALLARHEFPAAVVGIVRHGCSSRCLRYRLTSSIAARRCGLLRWWAGNFRPSSKNSCNSVSGAPGPGVSISRKIADLLALDVGLSRTFVDSETPHRKVGSTRSSGTVERLFWRADVINGTESQSLGEEFIRVRW